nr:MAG TPA: hypothetical protein [Caudoviricetes sp.]
MESINPVWFHQQEIFDEAAKIQVRDTIYGWTHIQLKVKSKEQSKLEPRLSSKSNLRPIR